MRIGLALSGGSVRGAAHIGVLKCLHESYIYPGIVSGASAGSIVASYDIPFEYPRQPELRFEPEFARISGEISASLRGAHA